jgi:hypothetical protein
MKLHLSKFKVGPPVIYILCSLFELLFHRKDVIPKYVVFGCILVCSLMWHNRKPDQASENIELAAPVSKHTGKGGLLSPGHAVDEEDIDV